MRNEWSRVSSSLSPSIVCFCSLQSFISLPTLSHPSQLKQSTARKFYSPDAKPTNAEKTQLLRVISSTKLPSELADDERDLLWTYRYPFFLPPSSATWSTACATRSPRSSTRWTSRCPPRRTKPKRCSSSGRSSPSRTRCSSSGRRFASPPRERTPWRSWTGGGREGLPCRRLTDEDLELFLLQLVQALR